MAMEVSGRIDEEWPAGKALHVAPPEFPGALLGCWAWRRFGRSDLVDSVYAVHESWGPRRCERARIAAYRKLKQLAEAIENGEDPQFDDMSGQVKEGGSWSASPAGIKRYLEEPWPSR